jgi:hypothetical protein
MVHECNCFNVQSNETVGEMNIPDQYAETAESIQPHVQSDTNVEVKKCCCSFLNFLVFILQVLWIFFKCHCSSVTFKQ